MILYAIRRKGTNLYLPSRVGTKQQRGGFSWNEPVEGGGRFGPRFFFRLQSARNALTAWLQGCWVTKRSRSGEYGEDVDIYTVPEEPDTPRHRSDMEIVPFVLREKKPSP